MKRTLLIILAFTSFITFAQQDIATARTQVLGSTVTITGIVTNGDEMGIIRYIEDGTAGIALYDLTTNNYLSNVLRGDSISITGELADYNGLLEVYVAGSPIIHSSNNPLPVPQSVTPAMIGEDTEAELVQINNTIFNNGGSVFTVGTHDFNSGGQQGKVYIKSGSPLENSMIPIGPVTLIGISSQYTFIVPANDGYQILPRDSSDIISSGALLFTSAVEQTNITTTGFDLSWTVSDSSSANYNYGTSSALGTIVNNGGSNMMHTVSLTGLAPATFYYVECFSINGNDTAFSSVGLFSTASNSTGAIRPYFNHSVDNSFSTGTDAQNITTYFNDTIKAYMDLAQTSLDICVYNASDGTIANAINDAYNRGVSVRYIADDDVVNSMLSNLHPNIPVVYRNSSLPGIMHNKFIIIDANSTNNSWIMGGSTNWSNPSNLFNDYNNIIFIQDQALAKAYTLEFEEMWAGNFGSQKSDNTPHKFNVAGKHIELYFSPSDQTTSQINKVIQSVDYSFEFGLLSFTRDDLAQTIIDKNNEFGISIRGIIEDENSTGSEFANLQTNGVNMRSHTGVPNSFHHKYAIADANVTASEPILITGSHNWSNNAENNSDENTLIIYDATIANIYLQEFEKRWSELSNINTTGNSINLKIDVFPNPSTRSIDILNDIEIYSIRLFDASGMYLARYNSFPIDIDNQGIYFLKIFSEEGIVIKKVVIN